MAIKTYNQIATTIATNITNELNKQNTATRVREPLNDLNDTLFGLLSNIQGGGFLYINSFLSVNMEEKVLVASPTFQGMEYCQDIFIKSEKFPECSPTPS